MINTKKLIDWYKSSKRDLPWRDTINPYFIWLSEVILQQTRVSQGLPYYKRFIELFPTVEHLARSSDDEVMRAWQGLGYYSRARNLHACSKIIVEELGGSFPNTYNGLIKLKGVGSYTAAAIASFAFREPVAVLDGNVFRVLARCFAIKDDISMPASKKIFSQLAQQNLPDENAHIYNQAIMELGAQICTPNRPLCTSCPLANGCIALKNKLVGELPYKSSSIKVKKRYIYYIIFVKDNELLIRKRNKNDIWKGLYDFYSIESEFKLDQENIIAQLLEALPVLSGKLHIDSLTGEIKHQLTHRTIYARFLTVRLNSTKDIDCVREKFDMIKIPKENLLDFPKPALLIKVLEKFLIYI